MRVVFRRGWLFLAGLDEKYLPRPFVPVGEQMVFLANGLFIRVAGAGQQVVYAFKAAPQKLSRKGHIPLQKLIGMIFVPCWQFLEVEEVLL